MTPDEIRADIEITQRHIDKLSAEQARKRQTLAQALCPFKVGDRVEFAHGGFSGETFTVGMISIDDRAAVSVQVSSNEREAFWTDPKRLRSIAPPDADPAVEAVADMLCNEIAGAMPWTGGPSRKAQWEALARRIIAAIDAARAERRAVVGECQCYDCGAPYGRDGWCDVIVPDAIWNEISGNIGILCFRCMTKRLESAGKSDVPVIVASGPYRDANEEWRLIGWEHGHKVGLNARAERRAKAQERRVELLAEAFFNFEKALVGRHDCWSVLWDGGKGKYRDVAKLALAAADAAEARDDA